MIVDERGRRAPASTSCVVTRRTGRTVALIGASGVGKSTLVNALVGADVQATGEVRATRSARPPHHDARELVLLPGGGVLVDTPGCARSRSGSPTTGFRRAFADIEALAPQCRFHDCAHDQEPGCAVQAAVARGELDAARVRALPRARRRARHGRAARSASARSSATAARSAPDRRLASRGSSRRGRRCARARAADGARGGGTDDRRDR